MNTENTYKKENMKKMIQDTMCQRVSAPTGKGLDKDTYGSEYVSPVPPTLFLLSDTHYYGRGEV